MKIGLLASGKLGLNVFIHLIENQHEIVFVMTDKGSSEIIQKAKNNNIDLFIGNPRNGNSDSFIENKEVDVLMSINYLFVIEEKLIQLPSKLAFNIHGSLLPKYRGRTPHVWAIINNEKETGITAHVIDSGCDTGNIIEQIKVPINENDTGGDLLLKYSDLYIPLVNSVLQKIELGTISFSPQDNSLASYFGKRVPADGEIDWNWQKERIQNWVRAQSNPYPGAFSFINDKKIIIDEIAFSNRGFNFDVPNGMILEETPLIVKTPNGTVELINVREGKEFCLKGLRFN